MTRRDFLQGAAASAACAAPAAEAAPPAVDVEIAGYYFPNYHPDRRNDGWHGKGWTEWELVKAARPRFPGHRQPVVPAWGYFDEADPKWAAREVDLAADHGVTCFIYDWYWYQDGPYLQEGLEKGFLRAENNRRLKFALMWANHDWLNIHPAAFTNHPETLAKGAVSRAAWDRLTTHVVAHYFSRPNYLKIDGEPVLLDLRVEHVRERSRRPRGGPRRPGCVPSPDSGGGLSGPAPERQRVGRTRRAGACGVRRVQRRLVHLDPPLQPGRRRVPPRQL